MPSAKYKIVVIVAVLSGNSLAMVRQRRQHNTFVQFQNGSCWNGMISTGSRYHWGNYWGVCRNGALVQEGCFRSGQRFKIGEKFIVDGKFQFECYLRYNGEIGQRHVGCTSVTHPGKIHYLGQIYDDGDVRKMCLTSEIDILGCLIKTYYTRENQFYPFNSTINKYYSDFIPGYGRAIGMGTCTLFSNGTYQISMFSKCDFSTQWEYTVIASLRAGCTKYIRDPSGGRDTKLFLSCRTGDINIKRQDAFICNEGRKKYQHVDENLKCDV